MSAPERLDEHDPLRLLIDRESSAHADVMDAQVAQHAFSRFALRADLMGKPATAAKDVALKLAIASVVALVLGLALGLWIAHLAWPPAPPDTLPAPTPQPRRDEAIPMASAVLRDDVIPAATALPPSPASALPAPRASARPIPAASAPRSP